MARFRSEILEDAREWARGRSWLARAPLLLYLGYGGIRHLGNPEYGTIFASITFGIHELGHLLFSPAGEFLMVAGGSICQIAAPLLAGLLLLRQRDWFGFAVALAWTAFSLFNLATYIGDARDQYLPLLGLSSDPLHDWNYLLSALHLLPADTFLAFLTRAAAFVTWAAAMSLGGWLLLVMRTGVEPAAQNRVRRPGAGRPEPRPGPGREQPVPPVLPRRPPPPPPGERKASRE